MGRLVQLVSCLIMVVTVTSCASVQYYDLTVENSLDGFYEEDNSGMELAVIGGSEKFYKVSKVPALVFGDVKSVSLAKNQDLSGSRYYVTFKFTKSGADKFSDFTMKNLNRHFYFVLGGEIVASPMGVPDLHQEYCTYLRATDFEKLFVPAKD